MKQSPDSKIIIIAGAICLATLSIISSAYLVGCTESYGRLQRSQEADQVFKAYRVLPDHQYYYTGPAGRPDAVMGIKNEYTLETTQWTQFNASDDLLKEWVDRMNFHHNSGVQYRPYGYLILDPTGSRLGIWYSIWDWTTILMKDDKRIQIFPPGKSEFFEDGDELDKMEDD